MTKRDLSIIIPARNEVYLAKTVIDLLKNIRGNTEIIVGLDGYWGAVPVDEKVTVVHFPVSIGQRAGMNQLARLAKGKYIMKVDAHCAFDEGFDVKILRHMQDDYTMVPLMKHLHVFDWKCKKCGSTWDQNDTPKRCYIRGGKDGKKIFPNPDCNNTTEFETIPFWEARPSPVNITYRFDKKELKFAYWRELARRPEVQINEHLVESMSIQGSCFILTADKYWGLGVADENHGSWGQQGTEVACKTWLSGGKVVINKDTWYAHLFRTQGGIMGFPYNNPGSAQEKARKYSKEFWNCSLEELKKKWKPAKYDLNWLVERFAPVPDWHDGKEVQ